MRKVKQIVSVLIAIVLMTPCLPEMNVSAENSVEVGKVKEDSKDISGRGEANTTYMYEANTEHGYSSINNGEETLANKVEAGTDVVDGKEVGLFYHVWNGTYQQEDYAYDVSKIVENLKEAGYLGENSPELTHAAWIAAGGGHSASTASDLRGDSHWWGTPLFGYYRSIDRWVVERDVQMLTDAGVDFIVLDYTNSPRYFDQLLILMESLYKYAQQGYDVPQVAFYTIKESALMVRDLYNRIYKPYPEFEDLWYQMSGKPLMIGETSSEYTDDTGTMQTYTLPSEIQNYFTFRKPKQPGTSAENSDGATFPWLADKGFEQTLYKDTNGTKKSVISVSVAQHLGTKAFSDSAFYGYTTGETANRTRSYHNGSNDTAEKAYLHGYNFAEQFDYAIEQDPDIIFITGWNEWVATRLKSNGDVSDGGWTDMQGEPNTRGVILVDNADINNSRDIQPMSGGYGDNYYMQMISYIRKFKGNATVNKNLNTKAEILPAELDATGAFEQWDEISSYYLDYTEDTIERNSEGYKDKETNKITIYTDTTGRNDIYKMKVANDQTNVYFYVETVSDIEGFNAKNCMSLYLNSGSSTNAKWENNYDFAIGRQIATAGGLSIEKYNGSGWDVVGYATYKRSGNRMQLEIPLEILGYATTEFTLNFKWADNCDIAEGMDTFYLHGDAAPYGRLNYVYKGVADEQHLSYGDANIDKQGADCRDLVRIGKHLEEETHSANADLNRDSTTTNIDFNIMMKLLLDDLKQRDVHVHEDQAKIVSYEVSDTWVNSRTRLEEDGSIAYLDLKPEMSYDGDLDTKWNPQAKDWDYKESPYIIYALEQYHDLDEISLTFSVREHYFDIEVSSDGINFEKVDSVTKMNYPSYYEDTYTCTAYVNAEAVRYVKITFTGDKTGSGWMSLHEVALYGNVTEESNIPTADLRQDEKIRIESGQMLGDKNEAWECRVSDDPGAPGYAEDLGGDGEGLLYKTYDNSYYWPRGRWNPKARVGGYGNIGMLYTLEEQADLSSINLTFGGRRYYFDVYVSSTGEENDYEQVASVNGHTLHQYYTDSENGLVCTIDDIQKSNIKYIKIILTGNTGRFNWDEVYTQVWIELFEIEVYGKAADRAVVAETSFNGTWTDTAASSVEKSYDSNLGTCWTSQVENYDSEVSVVYTLDQAYDLTKLQLAFGDRYYYFKASVSEDGTSYTPIATVDAENWSTYYTDGYACTVDNWFVRNVKSIKIEFIGDNDISAGSTMIPQLKVFEIAAFGTKSVVRAKIIEGTYDSAVWSTTDGGNVAKAYDNDIESKWNPSAVSDSNIGDYTANYNPKASIVYTLDRAYDLDNLQLTFGNRRMYFTISGSTDGEEYVEITTVNKENEGIYYDSLEDVTTYICTLDKLMADNVKYLKVEFTGSDDGGNWITLYEIAAFETTDITWAAIQDATVEGGWETPRETAAADVEASCYLYHKSFDKNIGTYWNPKATDYKSGENIEYTLEEAYDLTRLQLTFGERRYYFKVYASTNGEAYTPIGEVTKENKAESYTTDEANKIYTCTFDNLSLENIKYLKIEFYGDEGIGDDVLQSTWVTLYEVAAFGQQRNKVGNTSQ